MPDQSASSSINAFIARTRKARDKAGYSQDDLAQLLRTTQGTYKNYEIDRPLPHKYVRQFCALCHVDIEWLYTGKIVKALRLPKKGATITPFKSKRS